MTKQTIITRPLGIAFLAVALVAASACDTLLEVNNPGDVTEEGLSGERALPVLVLSAYGELVNAYEDVILSSGLFSDELAHSGSFTNFRRMDQRAAIDNDFLSGQGGPWQPLSSTVFLADLAEQRIRDAEEGTDGQLAEALSYGAWARIFLAENFCEVAILGGPLQSPDAVMQEAESMLSEAIQAAQSAGTDDILNLARVGRARARLWLGDNSGAAADASAVPADFVFLAVHDATTNANDVAIFTSERRETTIQEPFWNIEEIPMCVDLEVEGEQNPFADPSAVSECPFAIEGFVGPDGATPLFVPQLYPSRSSDMPLASGLMAEWYEREAQGTADPFEQAIDLFMTANRLAQMRRLNHSYLEGGQSCFIVPEREEDTNPNL